MNPKGLSARNLAFARNIVNGMSGKDAATDAGYSKKTAESQASRLLRNAKVAAYIDALRKRAEDRAEFNAARVLKEIERLATVDITEAFDANGRLKPLNEIPEDVRRAISSVEIEDLYEGRGEDRERVGDLVKVRFCDKVRAIELAARHFKMLTDNVNHSGTVRLEDLVGGSRDKEE